jgi:phosphate transport system ATP-binding protein
LRRSQRERAAPPRQHGLCRADAAARLDLRQHHLRAEAGRHPQRAELGRRVERSLRQAALWDEVKDRLESSAFALSGGQKQRLCMARSLALEPEVILLDNPTSGLDPISTATVEESLYELKARYTIVMVPHSVQQAARVADNAAFLLDGELIEIGPAARMFVHPQDKRTEDYITGRFG